METWQIVLAGVAGVLFLLYFRRRSARLQKEE